MSITGDAGGTAPIHVPGDKSITHRALILGALAEGENRIRNALVSLDTEATAACLRTLGVAIPPLNPVEFTFRGRGARGLRAPADPLDCGNSGTTARLLLGVLAGCPFRSVLTGDSSLRSRPMRRVTTPLVEAGASFTELDRADRLPIAVTGGSLRPIGHHSARASAQVKSALLLAGVTGEASVRVSEPHLSRDHTERMLTAMGASVRSTTEAGHALVELNRPHRLDPLDLTVPGDFSSAAFLLALGALGRRRVRLEGVGVNPTRTGFVDALRQMHGTVEVTGTRLRSGEPVADLVAGPSALRGIEVGGADVVRMIDEIPALAIVAARADGETRVTGAAELRVKESDRLASLAGNLRAIGVDAEELPDGLLVRGTRSPLAGRVACHGDHRIAMAFGILAVMPGNRIEIDEPSIVDVSFPGFWETALACARAAA